MPNELAASETHLDEEMLTAYKKCALSAVTFRLYYSKDDYDNENYLQFKPDMAHQVFGESESIFGYRSLTITLNYLHNSSQCYVNILKSGIVPTDVQKPDDILESLNPWLPENFVTDKKEFLNLLQKEQHDRCFGTKLNEFEDTQSSSLFPDKNILPRYKITLCDTEDEDFKDFHRRFETLIVWFIDGANFIDLDDGRWLIFYVYEEFNHPVTNKKIITPVGFCTAYKFFAYPSNVRARISQFFVLPSHQKRGIGTQLYKEVVRKLREMSDVVDITVEEPTSTFRKIRDLDDALTIRSELQKLAVNFKSTSQEKIFKIMRKFKICKKQCQRLYDILGCYYLSQANLFEYRKYVDKIKRRIAIDVERESKAAKRFCNFEGDAVYVEQSVTQAAIESEHKKYMDEIEPCVKNLKKN